MINFSQYFEIVNCTEIMMVVIVRQGKMSQVLKYNHGDEF